jgi:hypothetical protein
MRILFALLMCLVFSTTETFALKGGPPYPVGTNIIGTYAGVLQGVFDPTNPRSSNTLGIFSIGIPQTGLASGSVAIFTGERTFVGTIQGIGDPNKATLRAALQAVPVVTGGGQTVTTLNFHADGTVSADIKTVRSAFNTVANTRLTGTSTITTTNRNTDPPTQTISNFVVDGFKQSNSAPTGGG